MNHTEAYATYLSLRDKILAGRNDNGYWTGQLSTSALSTAVAVVALKTAGDEADNERIEKGFAWLCQHVNADGSYGDTISSPGNMSTTLLSYAALRLCRTGDEGGEAIRTVESWLKQKGLDFHSDSITRSILKFYGRDYTFSLPILSMLVHCGVLPRGALKKIPGLPFELALLPASLYRFINLRVVSYALPALIGVGIYLLRQKKPGFMHWRKLRYPFIRPALRKLDRLVPESGGFLEAIPLTGFVTLCLIACKESKTITITKGLEFLRNQQREGGGWPIDTDLSTWVTTLSVKALGSHINQVLDTAQVSRLKSHLHSIQFSKVHPFMYNGTKGEIKVIVDGCKWLVDIQNTDGGFPTFCKGWGKLPFDKSCADLTGHSLLALVKAGNVLHRHIPPKLMQKIDRSVHMSMGYLTRYQRDDGSWLPLWFGNQHTDDKTNPVYGTAKVCIYLNDCLSMQWPEPVFIGYLTGMAVKAREFLLSQQNADGSWGGKKGIVGTIEETALAVSALAADHQEAAEKGLDWLARQELIDASPIGLYFAMLWYDEQMYPLVYYTEALRRYLGY
jgi:squalene-hopene/tetraprenyl-beta-curcumene cyclase